MAKKKLSLSAENEEDLYLFQIASKHNDYVLAHAINSSLGIHLVRVQNLEMLLEGDETETSLYVHYDGQYKHKIYLVKNFTGKHYIFPSLTKFQYFLMFNKKIPDDLYQEYMRKIRSLPGVLFISPVPSEFDQKFNLFLDEIELHLLHQKKESNHIKKQKLQGAKRSRIQFIPRKKN